ncbi:MAG: hypothetical protein HY898_30010 [Deltaproteobacteria bacterium]|nr:hypothetical protein [Deltaproteobacteria bacterium]
MPPSRTIRLSLALLAAAAPMSCSGGSEETPQTLGSRPACTTPTDDTVSWVQGWCADGNECETSRIVPGPGGDILLLGTEVDESMPGYTCLVSRISENGGRHWTRRLPRQFFFHNGAAVTEGWILVGSASLIGYTFPPSEIDGINVDIRGSADGIVAKLGLNGHFVWVRRFGDDAIEVPCTSESCSEAVPVHEGARSVAVDADGTLVITGLVHGLADLLGVAVQTVGKADAFVARLSAEGDLLWHRLYGGADDESLSDVGEVAIGPDRGIVAALPGGALQKLSPAGKPLWSASVVAASHAIAPNGDVVTIGQTAGPDFDTQYATISRLDPDGHLRWAKRFAEIKPPSAQVTETTAWSLSLDAAGNAVVGGTFCSMANRPCEVAFGSTMLSDDGAGDPFLLDLDDQGELRWVRKIGEPWVTIPLALLVREDAIFLGGTYSGGFSLGGFELSGQVGMHGFAARLGRCGKPNP